MFRAYNNITLVLNDRARLTKYTASHDIFRFFVQLLKKKQQHYITDCQKAVYTKDFFMINKKNLVSEHLNR